MRTTLVTATASLLLILAGVPGVTLAQIWINGQLVQGAELDQLQAIYGEPIPAGRYWLGGNGDWGYEGSYQVMGNLYTDNRNAPAGDSANSGGAWVDNHGSSGSIMRDENGCMYFSGGGVSGSTC